MRIFTYRVEDSADYEPTLKPRETLFVVMNEKGVDVFSTPSFADAKQFCEIHNHFLSVSMEKKP